MDNVKEINGNIFDNVEYVDRDTTNMKNSGSTKIQSRKTSKNNIIKKFQKYRQNKLVNKISIVESEKEDYENAMQFAMDDVNRIKNKISKLESKIAHLELKASYGTDHIYRHLRFKHIKSRAIRVVGAVVNNSKKILNYISSKLVISDDENIAELNKIKVDDIDTSEIQRIIEEGLKDQQEVTPKNDTPEEQSSDVRLTGDEIVDRFWTSSDNSSNKKADDTSENKEVDNPVPDLKPLGIGGPVAKTPEISETDNEQQEVEEYDNEEDNIDDLDNTSLLEELKKLESLEVEKKKEYDALQQQQQQAQVENTDAKRRLELANRELQKNNQARKDANKRLKDLIASKKQNIQNAEFQTNELQKATDDLKNDTKTTNTEIDRIKSQNDQVAADIQKIAAVLGVSKTDNNYKFPEPGTAEFTVRKNDNNYKNPEPETAEFIVRKR